jgi:DNA-binding NarL/FixJ family response regulator
MNINVAIVEDDDGIRQSLSVLIEGTAGLCCLSSHPTAEDALKRIPVMVPDVVLMDINLPRLSGIECARKLKGLFPRLQILMLTMYEDSDQIFNSLMAGASGYLLKRTPPAKIVEAIEEVHRGASPMSGKIARTVVQYFQNMKKVAPETQHLSNRELEILDLLAKGCRYKEIADALGISFDTVRSHLRNIYDKLHVHSRTEAVVKYLQK